MSTLMIFKFCGQKVNDFYHNENLKVTSEKWWETHNMKTKYLGKPDSPLLFPHPLKIGYKSNS